MMEAKAKKDLTWVHFVIILLLMFGVQYIPPVEPITAYGMKILGVFAGLLWGWSFCGMLWPSIMGIVALAVTGCYDTGDTAIVAAFGNYMVLNCLFLFVLVELLSDCGLVDYICRRLMAMEAIKGRPWLLFSVVLFIPFLLSAVGQVFQQCISAGRLPILSWTSQAMSVIAEQGASRSSPPCSPLLLVRKCCHS